MEDQVCHRGLATRSTYNGTPRCPRRMKLSSTTQRSFSGPPDTPEGNPLKLLSLCFAFQFCTQEVSALSF